MIIKQRCKRSKGWEDEETMVREGVEIREEKRRQPAWA